MRVSIDKSRTKGGIAVLHFLCARHCRRPQIAAPADGDAFVLTATGTPGRGTLTELAPPVPGRFVYRPTNPGASGTDTFTYTVTDGHERSLSGIVTTVDGTHGLAQLDAHPEAVKQAAVADRLVVTKSDLATEGQLVALEERLAALNPGALRIRSANGDADPARLLDTGLYQGAGRLGSALSWLNAGAYRRVGDPPGARHDPRVRAFAWFAEAPVDWPAFEDSLATLLELAGERILRDVRQEPGGVIHVQQGGLVMTGATTSRGHWQLDDGATAIFQSRHLRRLITNRIMALLPRVKRTV